MRLREAFTGIEVEDARHAYEQSVANGARSALTPTVLQNPADGTEQTIAEIELYGDCVLRFVSGSYKACSSSWSSRPQLLFQRLPGR